VTPAGPILLIAVGGNALIREGLRGTISEQFLERGGGHAIITSPAHIGDAMAGRTGTHLVAG